MLKKLFFYIKSINYLQLFLKVFFFWLYSHFRFLGKADILINCQSGNEIVVDKKYKGIDNVLTRNIIYRIYDTIVEIIFDTINQLEHIVRAFSQMYIRSYPVSITRIF